MAKSPLTGDIPSSSPDPGSDPYRYWHPRPTQDELEWRHDLPPDWPVLMVRIPETTPIITVAPKRAVQSPPAPGARPPPPIVPAAAPGHPPELDKGDALPHCLSPSIIGAGRRTLLTEAAFGNVLPESAIPARPRFEVEILRKWYDATIGRYILRVRCNGLAVGCLMDDEGGLRMPFTIDNGSSALRGLAEDIRKAVREMDPFHPVRITSGHDLTTDAVGSNA